MCSQCYRAEGWDLLRGTLFKILSAFKKYQDVSRLMSMFLVERHGDSGCGVRSAVPAMLVSQSWILEVGWFATTTCHSQVKVRTHYHKFHDRFVNERYWEQHYLGDRRLVDKVSTLLSCQDNPFIGSTSLALFSRRCMSPWDSCIDHVRYGSSFHFVLLVKSSGGG